MDRRLDRRRLLPILYLVAILAAESVLRAGGFELTLLGYCLLFLACIHRASFGRSSEQAISLAVAIVPMARILGLVMPLGEVEHGYWHALVAAPTLLAAGIAVRRAGLSRKDVGIVLNAQAVIMFLVVVPLAVLWGLAAYPIVGAAPLVSRPTLEDAAGPALAVGLSTGLGEELVFRGLLLGAATRQLGRLGGTVYVTVLFALVAAAPWAPALLAIVLVAGTLFALFTLATGSILPAAGAHAAFNVTLFLVAPFVLQG